jgi:hypothetical protein
MCEPKANQEEAVTRFLTELKRRFPESSTEVVTDAMGGFDVWVRLRVPEEDVIDATRQVASLEEDISNDMDVHILTTTGPLEEAA